MPALSVFKSPADDGRLPRESAPLFTWCLEQEQSTLLELLAFCAACTVDAVTAKQDCESRRIAHADALASALNLDMVQWFSPRPRTISAALAGNRLFPPSVGQNKS